MTLHRIPKALSLLLLPCAIVLTSAPASGVGTRQFTLDSLETFEGGDLSGVTVASDGTVRAGWTLGALPIPDATSVWSSVALPDGSVLLGTGSDGKIYRVRAGKVTVAAETGAMAVSALALAWNGDVVAGTFPDGKLFRFAPNIPEGHKPNVFVALDKTEDVWALAYDGKTKSLYAATGAEGKLFRVTADGRAEVHFDSEEAHLMCLAVDTDGTVYAGSHGKALLFKITGPGRHSVVYDFEGDDVRAVAIASRAQGHALYAIANKYSGSMKGLPSRKRTSTKDPSPQPSKPASAGKGELMRFDARGVAERMMKDDKTHYVSLALDEKGAPFVGTGAEGKVYTVDDNHVVQLVADTEERQVGTLILQGNKRLVATSDPVVLHEITGKGGADALWTSKALDAKLRAHFGLLQWRARGAVEIQTRTGNTEKPDKSWSGWSAAMTQPGKVTSPPARYLQIRGRWSRDPLAVLREVKISFVTDNARALLTELTVGESSSSSSSSTVPASGGPLKAPNAKVKIKWKVDNPDSDTLRYRLLYKRMGGRHWFSVLPPNEELTKTDYSWDTTGLPEGWYLIRVDATDELANPPSLVTRHSLESRPAIVDNTPPVLQDLQLRGTRLRGKAVDGVGPIARIEFALAGSKTWLPLAPTDGVFDRATERFEAELTGLVPPGPQIAVIRAYDQAGNQVTRNVATGGAP